MEHKNQLQPDHHTVPKPYPVY